MSSHTLYEPIFLACILPELFPRVALYTRSFDKHVLYKEESLPFTLIDRDRLLNNKTRVMYVLSSDIKEVSRFVEENLALILQRDDIDQAAKCEALTQTSSAYLNEIFSDPEQANNAERCRNLTGHLAKHILETQSITDLLQPLTGTSPFAIKHSLQVATMSMLVWSKLFPEKMEELVDIGVAGMLHDIGMSLILSNVLDEIDYWTTPTLDEVRRHPLEGYVFLRRNGQHNEMVLDAVRHHHERYFGGGYPGGLKGDEIKLPTQVIGLTDMYCTLTCERPTRKASTPEEAFKIIGDETHRCFSTVLFLAFKSIFN
jgi:HD-GYP domain-containing protein (c-di-GMP phosphodiesterase class II)